MDLPVLTFLGLWLLFFSFEAGNAGGLIFPGFFGWLLILIALIRVATILLRGRSFLPPYASRRFYAATWAV